MIVKTDMTSLEYLADKLNEIGWENVLQVIPHKSYDGTLYTIICKSEVEENG